MQDEQPDRISRAQRYSTGMLRSVCGAMRLSNRLSQDAQEPLLSLQTVRSKQNKGIYSSTHNGRSQGRWGNSAKKKQSKDVDNDQNVSIMYQASHHARALRSRRAPPRLCDECALRSDLPLSSAYSIPSSKSPARSPARAGASWSSQKQTRRRGQFRKERPMVMISIAKSKTSKTLDRLRRFDACMHSRACRAISVQQQSCDF